MEKILLSKDFFMYSFSQEECQSLPRNIYVLLDRSSALLIDTAFPEQAAIVGRDLTENHIEVQKIIVSHYHGDHFFGISEFPSLEIIGSEYYKAGFPNGVIEPEDQRYVPTKLIKKETEMSFGRFSLKIIPSTGHSKSHLHTIISNRFIHVGDSIIDSEDGKPALPLILHSVEEYIQTLKKLRGYNGCTLLLAHGKPIRDEEDFRDAIDGRLCYLENLLKKGPDVTLEECLEYCDIEFMKQEFHERNIKVLMHK